MELGHQYVEKTNEARLFSYTQLLAKFFKFLFQKKIAYLNIIRTDNKFVANPLPLYSSLVDTSRIPPILKTKPLIHNSR